MTKVQRFGHANWCLYAPGGKSRCICGTVKYNPPIADTQSKPAPAEGVAAPLEPSQLESEARKFRIIDKGFRDGTMLSGTWIDKIMAEFAAAVSKNLTLMEKKFDNLMADSNTIIKQRESRILELEKEIAALREKP